LFGRWRMWRSSSSSSRNGYLPLPEADPEAGLPASAAAAAAAVKPRPAQPAGAAETVQAAAAAAAAAADVHRPTSKASNGRVSQLTQALQHSTASSATGGFSNVPSPIPLEHSELLLSGLNIPKSAAPSQQQHGRGSGPTFAAPSAADEAVAGPAAAGPAAAAAVGGSAYERIMEQYEMKCEAVLTSVYQSMFKVSWPC
jgi:hypothetical protein